MKNITASIATYRLALDIYEAVGVLDDQYARAKNRWSMMLAENNQLDKARIAFEELEHYWIGRKSNSDELNPYPARFYVVYGDFLTKHHADHLALALDKYQTAYEILRVTEGETAGFTKDISKKILEIKAKLSTQSSYSAVSSAMYKAAAATPSLGADGPSAVVRPQ